MGKVSTSYKPGQSGNPKGRPKKEWTWSGVLKEIAERKDVKTKKQYKTLAGEALFREVLKGNIAAIKEFGDRLEGKPAQSVFVGDIEEKERQSNSTPKEQERYAKTLLSIAKRRGAKS